MSEVKTTKPRSRHPDRVMLGHEAIEVLKEHSQQIEDAFQGTVRLSYAQLVNFLIQSRASSLTDKEIAELRSKHFDEIKALKWAMNQLKAARANGEQVSAADILKIIQANGVRENKAAKLPRKPRQKKESIPVQDRNEDASEAEERAHKHE